VVFSCVFSRLRGCHTTAIASYYIVNSYCFYFVVDNYKGRIEEWKRERKKEGDTHREREEKKQEKKRHGRKNLKWEYYNNKILIE
jgi:hypothetical protein